MLRVKFYLKYIITVYFKWGEKKIIYVLLYLSRWKYLKIKLMIEKNDDVIYLKIKKNNIHYVLRIKNLTVD
jgi:hypothetical protein